MARGFSPCLLRLIRHIAMYPEDNTKLRSRGAFTYLTFVLEVLYRGSPNLQRFSAINPACRRILLERTRKRVAQHLPAPLAPTPRSFNGLDGFVM